MADWVDVANISDFPVGSWKVVDVEDVSVLVFNLDGKFYAIENLCSHDGGTLSEGHLDGDNIVCPRHGAEFCIKTGHVTKPPAYEDIAAFPTQITDGVVQVRDTRWD